MVMPAALGKGYNFVELMIRLAKEGKDIKVVDDQVLTPTSTKDLTEKLYELIQTEKVWALPFNKYRELFLV